jgi:Zn-dependent protease/predicted transcriptional regulator
MRWSFRVTRIAGIDVKVHATFFLIVLLGAMQWSGAHGASGAAFGASLILLLFVCVTLHELGHGVVARAFDVPVREIVLLPIGGVAVMGKNPDRPVHELLIAAAGPFVNVLLAAALFLVIGARGALGTLDARGLVAGTMPAPSLDAMLVWLFEANVTLVLFNLIPAFPLDGGRMLRAVAGFFTTYPKATRFAAAVGQLFALLFGVAGVATGNFILALVAVFIFFGAGMESMHTQAKSVLGTLRVGDAYNKYAITLTPADTVSRVVDYILTSYQPDFAVVQGGRLLGVVTRDDVMRALATEPADVYVAGIMEREVLRVAADRTLSEVSEAMSERHVRIAAVFDGDRYLGLVSREDIAEALTVVAFANRQKRLRQPSA